MRMLLTVAAAAVAATAGCSSQPAPAVSEARAGTLMLGTARVTVNGNDTGLTDQVACTVAGPLTTITTGTGQSGVTAQVSTGDSPVAASVRIRNLGGFTGTYDAGVGGDANVITTGRSYAITGRADGFTTSAPAIQTSATFAIDVAC